MSCIYRVERVIYIRQYISLLFRLWQNFEKQELHKRYIIVQAIQSKPWGEN